MRPFFAVACSLVGFATSPRAQTFIVDSANGPGTNFTDLPVAISTVASGATLHVRPGSYSAFFVSGKSLTIIGHRSATGAFPTVAPNALFRSILISSINASQAVTISGLRFTGSLLGVPSVEFAVTGCTGPVVIEDVTCSFTSTVPFFMNITNSTNVHAARLSLSALLSNTSTPSSAPLVVRNSTVTFHRLSCGGYRSAASGVTATAGMAILQQSRVVLGHPVIAGGAGLTTGALPGAGVIVAEGSRLYAFANAGAGTGGLITGGLAASLGTAGGVGLVLTGGSSAQVRGFSLQGGSGSPPGAPFTTDATSSVQHLPAVTPPSALLVGEVRPGNTVHYTLHAQPGLPAWFLFGTRAAVVPLPVPSLGYLELVPAAIVAMGNVPASGTMVLPSQVPAAWPDNFVLFAQFATFDVARNELSASNLFTATSRY